MVLKRLNLSYNKYANAMSWRIFMKNITIFSRNTLEVLDFSYCELTNSQLIGIVDGMRDAILISL